MHLNPMRIKTVRHVLLHPGIDEERLSGAGYDVEGCVRSGLVSRTDDGLRVTPRGRAAVSAHRTRVRSGAFLQGRSR